MSSTGSAVHGPARDGRGAGGIPASPGGPAPGVRAGAAGAPRAAPGPPPLAVAGLTVAHGDAPSLLEGVTFTAGRGEILGILGPSGCGKSSLLRHLVGLAEPRAGKVRLFGEDIFADGERGLARARRRFGVMYQGGALFGDMNLLENVGMPLREFTRLPPRALEEAAALKLSLVGLSGFERHMPSEISGGMRKRCAIARAMALEPGLLFLDEPSAGLDPVTAASLDGLILSLSRNLGITFVMVTHELRSIMRAVDRAILLDRKRKGIVAEGTPPFLARESEAPEARAFFLRDERPDPQGPYADGPGAGIPDAGDLDTGDLDTGRRLVPPAGPGAATRPAAPGGDGLPETAAAGDPGGGFAGAGGAGRIP